MKREIEQGEVPDIMLNMAESLVAPDSSTWLWVEASGAIQRFDAGGLESWSVQIHEPEREALLSEFMAENAAKPVGSFFPLRYVLDVAVVGDEGWVLLGNSLRGTASVRVIKADGSLGSRLEFPGVEEVDQVAVDLERGWVYFVRPDVAELVRVPLRSAG